MSGYASLKHSVAAAERAGCSTFRRLLVAGAALDLLLLSAGLLAYPTALATLSARASIAGCAALLALYLAVGLRGPRATHSATYVALRRGLLYGPVLGALWIVQILLLYLDDLSGHARFPAVMLVWILACALPTLAGLFSARDSGYLPGGALAGLWSGMISAVLAVTALLVVCCLFMPLLETNPYLYAGYLRASLSDLHAFILVSAAARSILQLAVFGLLLSSALGALGGLVGWRLARRRALVL